MILLQTICDECDRSTLCVRFEQETVNPNTDEPATKAYHVCQECLNLAVQLFDQATTINQRLDDQDSPMSLVFFKFTPD